MVTHATRSGDASRPRGPVRSGAHFDPTGAFRYTLWREWDREAPRLAWVLLNPSTADADVDDPTIRRCMSFAWRWGYGSIEVVNLYAWRASKPAALEAAGFPVGPGNDRAVRRAVRRADRVVVGWGAFAARDDRFRAVLRRLGRVPLSCLGTTAGGQPRHPLYVRGDTEPLAYKAPATS